MPTDWYFFLLQRKTNTCSVHLVIVCTRLNPNVFFRRSRLWNAIYGQADHQSERTRRPPQSKQTFDHGWFSDECAVAIPRAKVTTRRNDRRTNRLFDFFSLRSRAKRLRGSTGIRGGRSRLPVTYGPSFCRSWHRRRPIVIFPIRLSRDRAGLRTLCRRGSLRGIVLPRRNVAPRSSASPCVTVVEYRVCVCVLHRNY